MRRIAVMSLLVALTNLGATVPAHGDTPGCVSRHEYDRIVKGMPMTKVHAIFDTEGRNTGLGGQTPLYYYRTCARNSQVQVSFNSRDRVVSKAANWFS